MTSDSRFKSKTPKSSLYSDEIGALVEKIAPKKNRDLIFQVLNAAVNLASDETDRLDLKIVSSALIELNDAFTTFAPYRSVRKLTIFGSARTKEDDPNYRLTAEIAKRIASEDWMIITGAGPGIMAAGIEGAGRDRSFGVNIKLPFESSANLFIAQDPKLVEMKYFFTRKLIFMKESDAFVVMPGGFGTLDEAFELLTLVQTGKAQPAPIVLLEAKGEEYWSRWLEYVEAELFDRGMVSPQDRSLFRITDDVDEAVGEILTFYRNYHSMRWVGNLLIIRMQKAPTPEELEEINRDFGLICQSGTIEAIPITGTEKGEKDAIDMERIALRFDRSSHGLLRQLIDRLNHLSSICQ
ncbi:MAG: TIGR00730 family Rossman fold protein [Actinomycetota bacterium]|nr:TIGR00730 family Rossman fold protein [Actinomycetota bacterium]